jgi:hypothetical protein
VSGCIAACPCTARGGQGRHTCRQGQHRRTLLTCKPGASSSLGTRGSDSALAAPPVLMPAAPATVRQTSASRRVLCAWQHCRERPRLHNAAGRTTADVNGTRVCRQRPPSLHICTRLGLAYKQGGLEHSYRVILASVHPLHSREGLVTRQLASCTCRPVITHCAWLSTRSAAQSLPWR